jgi:hypothetical protein
MDESELLNLSVGDCIADSRLSAHAYSGKVAIQGKSVNIDVTRQAVKAASEHLYPILIEVELYFSCLVRKQVRFRTLIQPEQITTDFASVLPGLFASFRAVCTMQCKVADVAGKPPVETMPVKKPGQFVPDWIKVDFHAGQWIGEYGFERSF